MERLYLLTRQELIDAVVKLNSTNPEARDLYDPFTDQQLRDYIVNVVVTAALNTLLK